MNKKEARVTAVARQGVDLPNLARPDGPLSGPCGTVDPSIARDVLNGNGQAEILVLNLKMAIDTQGGIEHILDNFELYDANTKRPFIWSLLNAYLKS